MPQKSPVGVPWDGPLPGGVGVGLNTPLPEESIKAVENKNFEHIDENIDVTKPFDHSKHRLHILPSQSSDEICAKHTSPTAQSSFVSQTRSHEAVTSLKDTPHRLNDGLPFDGLLPGGLGVGLNTPFPTAAMTHQYM